MKIRQYEIRIAYIPKKTIFEPLIIKLIFLFFILSCRTNTLTLDASCKKNYLDYSKLINFGQKEVLNKNYQEAYKKYVQALSSVTKKPLPQHYFTSIQLAITLKKTNEAKELIVFSMQKGLSPNMFYNDSLINDFLKSYELKNFVERHYIKEKLIYEKSINRFLYDTIAKLSALDNKWKAHYLDSLHELYFEDSDYKETIYHYYPKV